VATESQDEKQIRLKVEAEAAAMRIYYALEVIRQERRNIVLLSQSYDMAQNESTRRRDGESFWGRIKSLGLKPRLAKELAPNLPR
jgi:hypothetical protein